MAADNGITSLSNYMLYNFMDDPSDLYRRMRLNISLNERLGLRIWSFPMRYQPVNLKEELLSNLVYGRAESGGFPSYFPFIDAIDELHLGDEVSRADRTRGGAASASERSWRVGAPSSGRS